MKKLTAALLGLILASSAFPASAATAYSVTFAELNCNWQGYTNGESVDGVDLTWAKGSGSSRKYIRAQRVANLMSSSVRASLYSLTECDTQMLADLAHLRGSTWKYIGGSDDLNHGGFLYDSSKWTAGSLAVTKLPGDPDGGYTGRRLLEIGFTRRNTTAPMLKLALTHLSSGNPEARDLQMEAAIEHMDGKVRLLSGDINASTPPSVGPGPRRTLVEAGWDEYGEDVPSWHDYGRRDPGLALDMMAVSPEALAQDRISISNFHGVDTAPTYASDHQFTVATVAFS